MTYNLEFTTTSKKEWDSLDNSVKREFKRKLEKVLESPVILNSRLHGYKDLYKVKLRKAGYRLIYQVIEQEVIVLVLAVNRRDKIYDMLPRY